MKKFLQHIFILLALGIMLSCTTERRDDQGEYSEEDNEVVEDSVQNENNY